MYDVIAKSSLCVKFANTNLSARHAVCDLSGGYLLCPAYTENKNDDVLQFSTYHNLLTLPVCN